MIEAARLATGRSDSHVGMTGFEPATPCSRSRCATKLRYIPLPPPESDAVPVGGLEPPTRRI